MTTYVDIFSQIEMQCGLKDVDAAALNMLACLVARDGAVFIEVGSWKGQSAAVLGKVALECNGKVICVDHWRKTQDSWQEPPTKDLFDAFRKNIDELGLGSVVHPILTQSAMAAKILKDEIANLVFIDADHRYEAVMQDIQSWLPKVKKGGILCGHDCEKLYTDCSSEVQYQIDTHLHMDFSHEANCHAGVVKAVHDCFGRRALIAKDSKVWMIKKENNGS